MRAKKGKKALVCACVSHLCLESKRNTVSPWALFFLQQRCQGLLTFNVASVVNLNGLFVALSHQINPSLCITCNAHTRTHTTWKHNWGEMSVVKFFFLFFFPWGALNNISVCFCSPSILSHPVFPWSFYEHLLMQSFLLHLGLLLFHYAWWRD